MNTYMCFMFGSDRVRKPSCDREVL